MSIHPSVRPCTLLPKRSFLINMGLHVRAHSHTRTHTHRLYNYKILLYVYEQIQA